MQLEFEHVIDYQGWSKRLLFTTLLSVPAVFALASFGVVMLALAQPLSAQITYMQAWVLYALLPAVASLLVMLPVSFGSLLLIRAKRGRAQVQLYLAGLAVYCLILAGAYSQKPIFSVLFCLPVFLSVTFVEKRLIKFAFFCSLLAYAAMVTSLFFAAPAFATLRFPSVADVIFAIIFLVGSLVVSLAINHRQMLLVSTVDSATDKTWRDSLTGLYNHNTFYHQLDLLMEQSQKNASRFCLIVMDIDNFKAVNDKYGHVAGDEVLRLFVQSLTYETGKLDVSFRYGGEEFAILTRRNLDESFLLSCEIRKRFHDITGVSYLQLPLTASAGICLYSSALFEGKQAFFSAADRALYQAKHSGKDQSVIWVPNLELNMPDPVPQFLQSYQNISNSNKN